jgi:hypothetical protein
MYFDPQYFPAPYFTPTYFGNPGPALADSLPSCDRRLAAPAPGFAGIFEPFIITGAGVVTFDLEEQLANCAAPGETIISAQWSVVTNGPGAVTDPDPNSRMTGSSNITGSLVSMRFGNWQSNIPYILYRVDLKALTTQNNVLTAWAYIPVYSPIA